MKGCPVEKGGLGAGSLQPSLAPWHVRYTNWTQVRQQPYTNTYTKVGSCNCSRVASASARPFRLREVRWAGDSQPGFGYSNDVFVGPGLLLSFATLSGITGARGCSGMELRLVQN